MSPVNPLISKGMFARNEQEQEQQQQHPSESNLSRTKNVIAVSVGTILLSIIVTLLAVMYWCTRRHQRLLKTRSSPSELTPFSSASSAKKRPKEITLETQFTHGSLSDTNISAKQFRQKNLLQRRGSNNSLTISLTPKHRLVSPPTDCPTDEYLQTATRKLTIDELHQRLQDTRSLYQEFWSVPTNHLEKLRICGAGTKNRYGTIIPNEHSRVKLAELADDPISSYINANYVKGWPNEQRAFIATQGPLSNTILDFYRMIWQESVPVIVMITRLYEQDKPKCERYIPDEQTNRYGPFDVEVKSIVYKNDYEIRRLIVKFENEQRELDHYWYTAWPDHSCPDVAQPLIELVHNVEESRLELSQINQKSGPVIVHCSAGIGRTGCFIALSNGIKQLNGEHHVDVVRILCDLRRDRGGMIQTNDQYGYLYQALSEYARTLQR